MLFTKMKKNIVVRNGTHGSPAGPMTSSAIPLRTNSTTLSMRFCRPVGTIFGLRNATTNSTITIRPARIFRNETRLKHMSPLPRCVSKISVPGGELGLL
jgi:hypothetical protein